MHSSSLFKILRTLSKQELSEFNDMVCSPYFNRKSAVEKFWKTLQLYAPGFDSPKLEKEKVYEQVFPGKGFNYGTMKNLIYDLTKLAEQFLELKVYNSKGAARQLNLLEGFLERNLNSFFEKSLKGLEESLESSGTEAEYHNTKYMLHVMKQNYLIQQDRHYQTLPIIRDANENLTMAYFIDAFDNNYNSLFIQNEIKTEQNNAFIKKVIAYYKSSPAEIDFRVKVYYNAFMLIYDGAIEYFYELKRLLEENFNKLSSEQKYNFFVALANYSLKKYDEGLPEFAHREYEIYRFMIENGIYSIDKIRNIDGAFYKNVAATALKSGEIKWAKEFIEKYKALLEPEVMENYYFHALIEYYLKLRDFEEALRYLSRIRHTNHVDKLNIKRWEIITSYELGHFEELRYIIDSAKHFLQNNDKVTSARKERLHNFVSITTKLLSIKENRSKAPKRGNILRLKKLIKGLDTSYKEWLWEKIEELE